MADNKEEVQPLTTLEFWSGLEQPELCVVFRDKLEQRYGTPHATTTRGHDGKVKKWAPKENFWSDFRQVVAAFEFQAASWLRCDDSTLWQASSRVHKLANVLHHGGDWTLEELRDLCENVFVLLRFAHSRSPLRLSAESLAIEEKNGTRKIVACVSYASKDEEDAIPVIALMRGLVGRVRVSSAQEQRALHRQEADDRNHRIKKADPRASNGASPASESTQLQQHKQGYCTSCWHFSLGKCSYGCSCHKCHLPHVAAKKQAPPPSFNRPSESSSSVPENENLQQHRQGRCNPCWHFAQGKCNYGSKCRRCHLSHAVAGKQDDSNSAAKDQNQTGKEEQERADAALARRLQEEEHADVEWSRQEAAAAEYIQQRRAEAKRRRREEQECSDEVRAQQERDDEIFARKAQREEQARAEAAERARQERTDAEMARRMQAQEQSFC